MKYIVRTRKNVEQADATLIFTYGELTGGSLKTAEFATKYRKPWKYVDLNKATPNDVKSWMLSLPFTEGSINIAGSRGSKAPGLEEAVEKFLLEMLQGLI